MNPNAEQIVAAQKESWDKFSSAWRKWDKTVVENKQAVTDEMVKTLSLKKDDVVLDVSSGTGEPALSIAESVPEGKVIATDLSEGMLKIAMDKAKDRGIENFETKICDADHLPFEDNTFDAVSCRFGIMFFPDMSDSLKEMKRVLKPGGRIVAAVWNVPARNYWVTAISDSMKKFIEMPPMSPPDQPGMFRCAGESFMTNMFKDAGLRDVKKFEVNSYDCFDRPEIYWDIVTEMSIIVVTALEKESAKTKEEIRKDLMNTFKEKFPDGKIELESSAIVVYGEK